MTAAAPVSYGTGLLRTTVVADGAGFRWTRRAGPHAPAPFSTVPVSPLAVPGARAVTASAPAGNPSVRTYLLPAAESIAAQLLRRGPDPTLRPALTAAGMLLRALHDRPAAVPLGAPPPVGRLAAWLGGRARRDAATRAATLLRARLGARRWTSLAGWCSAPGGPLVAAHGAPGLGSLVVDPDTGRVALLTGEDAGAAPREHDVGWLIGELVELSWCAGTDQVAWAQLADAVLDGYGGDRAAPWHRWCALRVALHLHDFSAYVAWRPDELTRYAPLLARLIDG